MVMVIPRDQPISIKSTEISRQWYTGDTRIPRSRDHGGHTGYWDTEVLGYRDARISGTLGSPAVTVLCTAYM